MIMTVGQLKSILNEFDDDLEVMTKKTEFFGNVGYIHSVKKDSFARMGQDIPCVLLSDEFEEHEDE